jgi:hypothetical protein
MDKGGRSIWEGIRNNSVRELSVIIIEKDSTGRE